MIKTVWHWGNIAKTAAVIICVISILAFVPIAKPFGFFIGMLAGGGAAAFCLSMWDLWHFEDL